AVGNLVGGEGCGGGEREGCLEQHVGLLPVDVVDDVDGRRVGVELEVLHKLRRLPGAGDADDGAEGRVLDQGDRVDAGDGGHLVEGAGVDVPGVVVLGGVLEGLELVAAGALGESFVVGFLVEKAGDAAGGWVDYDAEGGILHGRATRFEVGGEGAGGRDYVQDLVAER